MKRSKISQTILTCLITAALFLTCASLAYAEVIVIANSGVPVDSIDKNSLRDIFLGKKAFWDKDNKIVVTILKKGAIHEEFLTKYVGKTSAQFQAYWNKLLYTGTGTPPVSFNTEQELVDYVSRNKGAVGYIDAQTPHKNVKVIRVQ
jgi:ABC-type phosphate transport system substrate-binding protein